MPQVVRVFIEEEQEADSVVVVNALQTIPWIDNMGKRKTIGRSLDRLFADHVHANPWWIVVGNPQRNFIGICGG